MVEATIVAEATGHPHVPSHPQKKKKKKKGKKLDPDLLQKLTQNESYSYVWSEMHKTMKLLEINMEKI